MATDSYEDGTPSRTREEFYLEEFPVNEHELSQLLQHQQCFSSYPPSANDFYLAGMFSMEEQRHHSDLLRKVEEDLLPPYFCRNLMNHAVSSAIVLGGSITNKEEKRFLEAMVNCLGRRGPRPVFQLLHASCCMDGSDEANAGALLSLVYRLALAAKCLKNQEAPSGEVTCNIQPPHAMRQSLLEKSKGEEAISLPCWLDFTTCTVPQIYTTLSTFCHLALFYPSQPFRASAPPLVLPQCDLPSAFWNNSMDTIPFSLACMSPVFEGKWHRLYSSDCDGSSFLMFQNALIGYNGSTITLIRTASGDDFGYYTDCPWRVSKSWFGQDSDSFLFRLNPSLAIYYPTGQGKHYMYLNPSTHSRNRTDVKGLVVGGFGCDCPRLFVSESFEKCQASEVDTTYASGPLISPSEGPFFDVDLIEAWTCVNDKSFEEHSKEGQLQLDVKSAFRQRAARVDRAEFVDDFVNGATIMSNVFQHRIHARGRHDFEVDDDHGGYTINESLSFESLTRARKSPSSSDVANSRNR